MITGTTRTQEIIVPAGTMPPKRDLFPLVEKLVWDWIVKEIDRELEE